MIPANGWPFHPTMTPNHETLKRATQLTEGPATHLHQMTPSPRSMATVILVSLVPMLSPCTVCIERLSVLAIGQVLPGESPIPYWFDADPLVNYVLIPTDIDIMSGQAVAGQHVMEQAWRRYVRIYFPKNRDALVDDYDFFVFPDGYIEPFSTTQIADMKYGMENGLGSFLTTGGDLSSPNAKDYPGWKNSMLETILPVELNDKMQQDGSAFSIRVVKDDPPVLSMFVPLGIEAVKGASAFTYLTTRSGATIWGRLVSPTLPKSASGDWLVSWRVGSGGGVFWVVADDLDSTWWSSVHGLSQNEYAIDVFLNILLYSTGRNLPEDVIMMHDLRTRYWRYNEERLLLFSVLEFVDRFGANTRVLEDRIAEVDRLKEESFQDYRIQDFEAALDSIGEALARMSSISNSAMKLKDRALLWVYITEWSAVMGTLFASGFAVYSLLVKRRLYREVAVTRSR